MHIVSSRKVKRSLPKPSHLLWEALVYEKLIPKPAPNRTKNFHDMLMPLHDSMPSFMNFRRALDLLEFKNQASQCFVGNQKCPGVWNSFPFLAWDLSMHPRTQFWFATNFYALEHVHVVQIWIMGINALQTRLMHKKVQTNPKKSQKLTQHSCCSMLTLGKKWKSRRGNGYRFVHKGETFPTKTIATS